MKLLTAALMLAFSTTTFLKMGHRQVKYYVVTTMHWNMDYEDFLTWITWKAVEKKEYLDRQAFTNKAHSGIYVLFTSNIYGQFKN
jgi:hypothetical protein